MVEKFLDVSDSGTVKICLLLKIDFYTIIVTALRNTGSYLIITTRQRNIKPEMHWILACHKMLDKLNNGGISKKANAIYNLRNF